MKVKDEIEKYASEEDKPALRWLFERYHMGSEWRILAVCRFDRYGKASFECNRVWSPSSVGRRAYDNAMLDALMKERFPNMVSVDGWVSAVRQLIGQRDRYREMLTKTLPALRHGGLDSRLAIARDIEALDIKEMKIEDA